MKPQEAPRLEKRRAADFERELTGRARTWIPSWSLDEAEADFGLALLKIAARFNSEVAERLDRVGEKMALGFLDWLGLPAAAARPARMPVVMNLAETATEPVPAPRSTRMQVDASGATIAFETEADLQVIPGQLAAIVGVDPAKDEYYLPPPGLTSLVQLEPLPTAWKLKNFAAPKAKKLQVDPGLGFIEDMLVEIEGGQFRIVEAKDDLITIYPEVPAGEGWAAGTNVVKVDTFRPFDGARNLQEHILYIGDADLLNIEAAARIEIAGLGPVPDGVQWAYWGKAADAPPTDADPRWRDLEVEQDPPPTVDALVLKKPKGESENLAIGTVEGRWIRARLVTSHALKTADAITLRINPRLDPKAKPAEIDGDPIDWSKVLRPEIFVDSTPSPPSNFYPLGQQPRIFDTLYVGSEDAFSKKGATAWIQFDLSDAVFRGLSVIDASGIHLGMIVAAIDRRGALHLLKFESGTIRRLTNREPMRPGNVGLLPDIPPVMWMDHGNLYVAVASESKVHVWKELYAAPQDSAWEDHGAPGFSQDETIAGLARVDWGGPTLVAARGGKLSRKSSSNSADPWTDRPVNFTVAQIYDVQTDQPGTLPTRLIALDAASNLFDVTSSDPIELFKINDAIRPAAIEIASSKTLELIAVHKTQDKLRAWIGNTAIPGPKLREKFKFLPGSQIQLRFEDGELTGYVVAANDEDKPDRQVLSAWQPANAEFKKILFDRDIDLGAGKAGGTIAFAPVRSGEIALLPGSNRGEIFGATFGGKRMGFTVDTENLRSALAVKPTVTLVAGNTVACKDAAGSHFAKVSSSTATKALYANLDYYWLDAFVDVSTDEREVVVFDSNQTAVGVTRTDTTTVTFTTPPTPAVDHILVVNSAGEPVELVAISNPQGGGVADAAPQSISIGDVFNCWLPTTAFKGQFFPAVDLIGNALDANALTRGRVYSPDLKPDRQRVGAVALDSSGIPVNLVFEEAWDSTVVALNQPPSPGETVQFALDDAIASWSSLFGEPDANPTLSWEYWDGSGWTHLPVSKEDDETNNLRNSGTVRFDVPENLQVTEWAGKENFWVRARLIGGDYGEDKTIVTLEDLGNKKTKQTIDRVPDGVQPPYALEVGVAYAMDKAVIPASLLTRDSGSVRNQSDANRTPGAMVEIFTPLSVALGRLDASEPNSDASTPVCVPDCECPTGTASTSPKKLPAGPASALAPASTADRRALYLGFTSKLIGQPVNLLFLAARESNYDAIAPLAVDALIANRFKPIVPDDETRALGETGILKMSFDVPPLKADLFGQQSLSWLRVAPSIASDEWKPALAGVYPNAVWARSAETMTRELLGSSDGRPALTVALARPPLLRDTLELRVREPLGKDECDALTAEDPNLVKQGIEDLPGVWVLWKQVPDPLDCGPNDRVYALDEATGDVRFGDGRHGAIPPVGPDSIVAFAYERTDPAVAGVVTANFVKARQEVNLVSPVEGVESVIAADRSAGGVGPEKPEHVLEFAPATLRHRRRAVSLDDFEDLVRQHSADVVQARAFNRDGRVRLVVVARGTNPAPSRAQQRELRSMLLEISPAALGTRDALMIVGPKTRQLVVEIGLRVSTLDVAGGVAKEAKERLVARFSTDPAGEDAVAWPLGRAPTESDIAEALLDIAKLDEIVSIKLFEKDALGKEVLWGGQVRPSDLVRLAAEDVRVEFKLMEAAA